MLQDACLLVKLNQGMIGQAGATGEAFCQQQVPAATLAPQFVSNLGLEMVKSVLVQPIRCEVQILAGSLPSR